MGFIPETITSRLPSEVVGTLGVDPAGEQIGKSIARGGAKVFDALAASAVANRQKNVILETAEAEKNNRNFDVEIMTEFNIMKDQFRDNPSGVFDEFEKMSTSASEEFLADLPEGGAKDRTTLGIQRTITRRTNELKKWASIQGIANFGNHIQESVDALGEVVSNSTDEFVFDQALIDAEELAVLGDSGLSPKNAEKFREESKRIITEQYINNLLEEDPIKARDLLQSEKFTAFITPEKKEFLERQAAENAFMVESADSPKLAMENLNKNPNLTEIEKINATNKWFNIKNSWDSELNKIVKKDINEKTLKIFNDIQDGSINDISVLRDIEQGMNIPYKTRKSLEQDFQNKISGKAAEGTFVFNSYLKEILDGSTMSEDTIKSIQDLSPEQRIELIEIRRTLLTDPIYKSEDYRLGKRWIEKSFPTNIFTKLDPERTDKQIDAERDLFFSIKRQREVQGIDPSNVKGIIKTETDRILEEIRSSRSGMSVRTSTNEQVLKRQRELMEKLTNQTITDEEKEELMRLNSGE